MAPQPSFIYRARLVRVVDADTLVLDVDTGFTKRSEERIRLLGVDAPEMVGIERAEALEATRRLREMLHGKELVIETQQEKIDGFRRWLGTVWADGTNVNEWLIAEGLATVWRRG